MKIVRIVNNCVAEIFPPETYAKGIAYWYSGEYANASVEAPDDVIVGMVYNPDTGEFSPPQEPELEPTAEELIAAIMEGYYER